MSKNRKKHNLRKKTKYLMDKYSIIRDDAIKLYDTNRPEKVFMKFTVSGTIISTPGMGRKQFKKLCKKK
jgi:hypothetical protein